MPANNRILFICEKDDPCLYLREQLVLEGGYSLVFEESWQEAIKAYQRNGFDIVIVKPSLLGPEPFSVIRELKQIDQDCVIIVSLKEVRPEILEYLFSIGIYDFIAEPVNLDRFFLLVKKGIELHNLMLANRKLTQGLRENNLALEKQNILLASRIEDSTRNLARLYEDLRATYMRTIKALAQAIDARDHYTHSHSENVAKYAALIAQEMGLSAREVEVIRQACELHDLGKIGVEDRVLMKAGALTEEEWSQIHKHPVIAAQILEPLTFLNDVVDLVRQHHEHYDGSGYPDGKTGEDITLGARIINLADAYDAMRSARSYRENPLTREAAVEEIKKNSGYQFDPKVAQAFLRIEDKL